jgi:beta-glucosidase/6-phospho-beta-glucosidase/beta-galactosidase
VATAAHQAEGSTIDCDSWLMEHLPDSIYREPSGDAVDFYHRYPDDIAGDRGLGPQCVVMTRIGDRVSWVCTINEANAPLLLAGSGLLPQ